MTAPYIMTGMRLVIPGCFSNSQAPFGGTAPSRFGSITAVIFPLPHDLPNPKHIGMSNGIEQETPLSISILFVLSLIYSY